MNINVNIEQMVLDGIIFSPHSTYLLRGCIEKELAQLLVGKGFTHKFTENTYKPRMTASTIYLNNSKNPEQIGQYIAHSLHESIGNE